jgi:hypothetical protein
MTCHKFCSVSGGNVIKHIFSSRSREGISFFIIKLSLKLSKHGVGSLSLVDLWDATSKMVPKNYTQSQRDMQLRFRARLGTNSVSCQVSYLCIDWRSSCLGPLFLCSHIHCLCMFTSHVYFNVHTLIVETCIGFEVSWGILLFLSPLSFF